MLEGDSSTAQPMLISIDYTVTIIMWFIRWLGSLLISVFFELRLMIHYRRAFVQAADHSPRFIKNDVTSITRGKPHLSTKKRPFSRIRDAIVVCANMTVSFQGSDNNRNNRDSHSFQ